MEDVSPRVKIVPVFEQNTPVPYFLFGPVHGVPLVRTHDFSRNPGQDFFHWKKEKSTLDFAEHQHQVRLHGCKGLLQFLVVFVEDQLFEGHGELLQVVMKGRHVIYDLQLEKGQTFLFQVCCGMLIFYDNLCARFFM